MTHEITIRPLSSSDLPQVAEIHLLAFPSSALTRLGKEAVRRYYEWQMVGPHDLVAVGAFLGDQMAGFSFGGTFRGAVVGYIRRNWPYLLFRSLSRFWLFTDGLFRSRVKGGLALLARFIRGKNKPGTRAAQAATSIPEYGILSIAVNPRFQGRGIGRLLMSENECAAQSRQFHRMGLNVSPNNEQAIRFYRSLGWEQVLSQEGVWKGKMRKPLQVGKSMC